MSQRFQLRGWPAYCPPLVGHIVVVDTAHHDRIVMEYTDELFRERGGAINAAIEDMAKWNASNPRLVPHYRARQINQKERPDGTLEYSTKRTPAVLYYDLDDKLSLYRDFHYVGL